MCLPLMAHAGERDTYNFSWLDPDKEVYVLQNRKFRKDGKFHLNVGAGLTTSGAFVDAKTFQGRAGYFFREDWGFEFVYAKNEGKENATASSVRSDGVRGAIPFRRIVDGYMGAMLMWSPFYSKINTFNSIIYIDWLFGLGYAKLDETNNRDEFLTGLNGQAPVSETHGGLMWDSAIKFYLNENWDLRLDLTVIHYKAEKAATGVTESDYYANWDLALSLGYSF
jgi:outer membrane beta-barrel protein